MKRQSYLPLMIGGFLTSVCAPVFSQQVDVCDRLDTKCFHNQGGLAEAAGQFDKALVAYRNAAELGFAESQMALGILYLSGKVGERSPEKAAFWYKLAAQGGNRPAMRNLAAMYTDGVGVDSNPEMAEKYRAMAAEAGDSQSLSDLISFYEQLDTDDREVREKLYRYTELAAQKGDPKYQNQLGLYHLRGFWTSIDAAQAHQWFKRASDLGYAQGTMNLAETYQKAWGTRRDWEEAMSLYKKAFEQGVASAAAEVSRMYKKGMGTRPRPDLAREWEIKAVVAGDPQSTLDLGLELIQQTEAVQFYPLGYALLRKGAEAAGADWAALSRTASLVLSDSDQASGNQIYQSFQKNGIKEADLSVLIP